MSTATPKEISVHELKSRLSDAGKTFTLLDVREWREVAQAKIPGSLHIPMADVARRVDELDPDQEIVVQCHHGGRSMAVATWLLQQAGFTKVVNLRGGIDAWSREVDPSVPRY